MAVFVDIVLLLLIALSIFKCAREGFVKSILDIVAFIAALFCANAYAPTLGAYFEKTFFLEKISDMVGSALQAFGGGAAPDLGTLFAEKPEAFVNAVERFQIDFSSVEAYFQKIAGESDAEALGKLSDHIASPLASAISYVAAFLCIFIAVSIALGIAVWIIDRIFNLPVLRTANKLLGVVLGVVLGVFSAWTAVVLFQILLPYLRMFSSDWFGGDWESGTVLYKFFTSVNPFQILLNGVAQRL